MWKDRWENLEFFTESSYVRQARAEDSTDGLTWRFNNNAIELVCRNNLDIHSGTAQLYGHFHGNLKRDGVTAVLKSALKHGTIAHESLYFSNDAISSVRELARKCR